MNLPNSLYRDGKIYDAMNNSLVADTSFYLEEFKNVTGPILELACGTGRITCAIAKLGKNITGLDLSETMLSEAKSKAEHLKLEIQWLLADMTQFQLHTKFDAIFIGLNSLLHVLTYQDLGNFLSGIKQHLSPGGRFLFYNLNPNLPFLVREKGRLDMDHYLDPQTGEHIYVTEENHYDAATQINQITFFFQG